jgi:hypothetical protein
MGPFRLLKPGRFVTADGSEVEFSETDLRATAEAYDPSLHEAPIVIGHPQDNEPAWGWVAALRWGKGHLWALPWNVEPAFAELVSQRRYSRVSASLYRPDSPANPKPGVWYLRHVGFLGAQPPAVKGLPPVRLSEANGVVVLEDLQAASEPGLVDRVREALLQLLGRQAAELQEERWRIGGARDLPLLDDDSWDGDAAREAMVRLAGGDPGSEDFDWSVLRRGHVIYDAAEPRLLGSYKFPFAKVVDGELRASRRGLIAVLQRAPQADVPESLRERIAAFARAYLRRFEEEEENMSEAIEAITRERDELRAQVEALTRELASLRERERRAAAEALLRDLAREGKVLPAEAAALAELLVLAGSSTVELGEGDKKQTLRDWLEAWLRGLPPRVPLGRSRAGVDLEEGSAAFRVPPGYSVDREKLELLERARAVAREKQVDLSDAIRMVAR